MVGRREERREKHQLELDERRRKYEEELDQFIKRSKELTEAGRSRISKDGRFLNIRAGSFSRFRLGMLEGYPKGDKLKLIEALTGTEILEELEILVQLKDMVRKESESSVFT